MSTTARARGRQAISASRQENAEHAQPVGHFLKPVCGLAWTWMALRARNASPWLLANFRDFEPPEHVPRTSARAYTCVLVFGRTRCVPRRREHEKRSAAGREKNANRVFAKVRFSKFTFFKNCPEGKIRGKFLKKKVKMYFIEGRFCSKVAVIFVSVLLAHNAPSIWPRQNASARAYSVPNRTGQTARRAPLFAQQQHKQRTHGVLRGYPDHDAQA